MNMKTLFLFKCQLIWKRKGLFAEIFTNSKILHFCVYRVWKFYIPLENIFLKKISIYYIGRISDKFPIFESMISSSFNAFKPNEPNEPNNQWKSKILILKILKFQILSHLTLNDKMEYFKVLMLLCAVASIKLVVGGMFIYNHYYYNEISLALIPTGNNSKDLL